MRGTAIGCGIVFVVMVLPFVALIGWFVYALLTPTEYSEIPRHEYVGVYAIDMDYKTRISDNLISQEDATKMRIVLYANGEAKIIDVPEVYWFGERSGKTPDSVKKTFSGAWENTYWKDANQLRIICVREPGQTCRELNLMPWEVSDGNLFGKEWIIFRTDLSGWCFERITTDTSGYDDAAPELSDDEKAQLYRHFERRPNHPMHAKHKALEEDVSLPVHE